MRAILLAALACAGCLRATEFHCIDSTQCAGGVCEAVGYCSFRDDGCASGQRFGDSAGTYAGQCVGGSTDDAGVDAPDDVAIDAPPACPATYAAVTGAPADRVYRSISTTGNWETQRTACAADGANAYLVIPDDATELMAINTLLPGDYWVGVTDSAMEGTFLNVKGDPQTFLPWDIGQPNNVNNSDCVKVQGPMRRFNDTLCMTEMHPAICECEL